MTTAVMQIWLRVQSLHQHELLMYVQAISTTLVFTLTFKGLILYPKYENSPPNSPSDILFTLEAEILKRFGWKDIFRFLYRRLTPTAAERSL